ncbi:hypothetical protein [Photobacterium nomapromontoriensis]|uniref:hypothetical protein n=1 Tax=Photobacterium nomapromontoriensis TaxID=2910237 RepID=UPI003D0A3B47
MNSSKNSFRLCYTGLWLLLLFPKLSSASEQSSFQQQFSRESESFQNQLDELVRDGAFPKKKGETLKERLNKYDTIWYIDVDMSAEHPIEKWDTIHTLPQLMFYYAPKDSLYTMDFNGTNVRRFPVPTNDESYLFIIRSPNGRFLYAGDTLYDLKTNKILTMKENSHLSSFSSDDKLAYIMREGTLYQLNLYNLEEKAIHIEGLDTNLKLYFKLDEKNDRIFWSQDDSVHTISLSSPNKIPQSDNSECKYKGRLLSNSYSKFLFCGEGKNIAIRNEYDLTNHYGNRVDNYTIQKDIWYMSAYSWDWVIARHRTSDENGLFDTLHYNYVLHNKNDTTTLDSIDPQGYVSESLQGKLDESKFGPYFPPIPTIDDYWASYNRQFKHYIDLLKSPSFSAAE